MRKRLRNKIIKKFQILDDDLVWLFSHGHYRNFQTSPEIRKVRYLIQYMKRRWPRLYYQSGWDLGHYNA